MIRIKSNSKSSKIFVMICLIFLIISSIISAINVYHYTSYDTIEAIIIAKEVKSYSNADINTTKTYYVTYKYTYNEQEYETKYPLIMNFGNNEGDIVQIKCSPSNPTYIINYQFLYMYIVNMIVSIVVSVYLYWWLLRSKYRESDEKDVDKQTIL